MTVKRLTGKRLGFLSLNRGYTGSSESTLVKIPHCFESTCHGSIMLWVLKRTVSNHMINENSKPCVERPSKKRPKIGFQDRLSLNAGQKYCRMIQESVLQYFRPIKPKYVIKAA